jgi:hypothetical protein
VNVEKHTYKTDSRYVTVGPLTLDSKNHRALTVFHTETVFCEDEYNTLLILATHEDETVSFEKIYDLAWDKGDGVDRRSEAHAGILNIIEQINAIEKSFMWIEHGSGDGFTFRTKWGHNKEKWATNKIPFVKSDSIIHPVIKPGGKHKRQRGGRWIKIAALSVAAAIVIFAGIGLSANDNVIIDSGSVPLAAIPETNAGFAEIDLENPAGSECFLVFEMVRDDNGETIYVSEKLSPGEKITGVKLTDPTLSGEYAITLIVSAYSMEDLNFMHSSEEKIYINVK